MVWHIFKKDWKLMWRQTAAVAGLLLSYALIQTRGEFGEGNPALEQFSTVLMLLWLVASIILVVILVHQDALPGTRQDWLTRPLRRSHVLLAKLLFATLAVQGPMIACDLLQGLGAGFPLRQTMTAALTRAVLGFLAITLPALALGALTKSIAEAMLLAVTMIGGVTVFMMIAIGFGGGYGHNFDPTDFTGVGWIPNVIRYALLFAGTSILLLWQYRTRNTFHGRVLMGGVLLAMLCSQCLPWIPMFAIEKRFSPSPGAAKEIGVTWQTDLIAQKLSGTAGGAELDNATSDDNARLNFPLLVTSLPQDTILRADKSQIVLSQANGEQIYSGGGKDLQILKEDARSRLSYDHAVALPASLYAANKDQLVRADIIYSLTLFRLHNSYAVPALRSDQMLPGWGRCKTRVNASETAIEMTCMQMGKGPSCATVFLQDSRDGSQNPVNTTCNPDYAPYKEKPIPDAVTHLRLTLQFRDPTGQARLPVDHTKLGHAQVVIREYEPQDHFSREVTSPPILLQSLAGK